MRHRAKYLRSQLSRQPCSSTRGRPGRALGAEKSCLERRAVGGATLLGADGAGYTEIMVSDLVPRPLVLWDGFGLRCDLDLLERLANRELPRRVAQLREVRIGGAGATLEVRVRAAWQGLPAQLVAAVSDLQLHRRFLGCRVVSLHGPLGIPVPISLVAAAVRRFGREVASLDPVDGILLVDLRRYIPGEVQLGIRSAIVSGRVLEIELSPGSLASPA